MKVYGMMEDLMGCGYHRILAPIKELGRHGHQTFVSHQPPARPELWDILQVQKFAMPELMDWLHTVKRIGHPKIVADFDDILVGQRLTQTVPEGNPGSKFYNDPLIKANLRRIAEIADAVTVTTPKLREHFLGFNDNVYVLPNYVPDHVVKPPQPSKFRLGWSGGSSHSADLDSIADQINRFLIDTGEPIQIIGQDYTGKFVNSTWHPWGSYDMYMDTLRNKISVGIAVVDDHPFNQYKSDIKLLEYAAAGVLPVYSIREPYATTQITGVRVADGDWSEALHDILFADLEPLLRSAYRSVLPLTHGRNWQARAKMYKNLLGNA